MHWLLTFLKPYYYISLIAAYGIAQNLEGVGWFGQFNNIYDPTFPLPILNLNPLTGVRTISVAIFLSFSLLAALIIRSGFVLGRKAGITAIFLILIPGILSLLGLSLSLTNFMPEEFHFGSGYIGGFWSSGVNFLIAFVWGWSSVIVIANLFKSQKFKHIYDHLWCLLTLVGCMYLVVDSQARSDETTKSETNKIIGNYLKVYEDKYSKINNHCLSNSSFLGQETNLCRKAREILTSLSLDRKQSEPEFRRYGGSWINLLENKQEIERLNLYFCSPTAKQNSCHPLPPELIINTQEIGRKIILPPPEHAERLIKLYKRLGVLVDKETQSRANINLKYFLFCMISLIAGGKAATASLSLIGESNMRSQSWLKRITAALIFSSWFLIKYYRAQHLKQIEFQKTSQLSAIMGALSCEAR